MVIASGVQPGTIDAVQYYSPFATRIDGSDVSGIVFTTFGNDFNESIRFVKFFSSVS